MKMEFRKKTTATILIALFMMSVFAVFVSAAAGDMISIELEPRPGVDGSAIAEFVPGTNEIRLRIEQGATRGDGKAKIRVILDPMRLGDLDTISWDVKVMEGYRPHLDIYLDLTSNGVRDTCLTAEFAQANGDVLTSELNTWLSTFQGGSGDYSPSWDSPTGTIVDLTTINGEMAVWEECLGVSYKLSDYQTSIGRESTRLPGTMINEDTTITHFDIEIDDDTLGIDPADAEAYVRNIRLNGVLYDLGPDADFPIDVDPFDNYLITATSGGPGSITPSEATVPIGESVDFTITPYDYCYLSALSVNGELETSIPAAGGVYTFTPTGIDDTQEIHATFVAYTVSISVNPTSWSIGKIPVGGTASTTIDVTNTGEIDVDVSVDITEPFFQNSLTLNTVSYSAGWELGSILFADFLPVDLVLTVPVGTSSGNYAGTLVFTAVAPSP